MNRVSGHYLSCIIDACEKYGLSKDVMEPALAGINIDNVTPLQRFDGHHLVRLYDVASKDLNEPNIGLRVGQRFNVSWLNETGKVLPVCDTLGEAAFMMGRYHQLTQSFGKPLIKVEGKNAILEWDGHYEDFEAYKHVIEAVFAGMVLATKWLLLNEGSPVEYVQFRHAAHGNTDLYEEVFGCPVYFGRDVDAIAVNSSYLNAPLITKNSEMKLEMCRKLDRIMFRHNEDVSFLGSVEASIRDQLHDGTPRFSVLAENLNMSERSLRGKLSRQATSFRQLVTKVRRDICEAEMHKGTQIVLIGQKLGFHDQSAFNHAFNKWYGMSPRDYRANHSAALGAK